MKVPHITKYCERCELPFELPNIRPSKAREYTLMFAACTHCGYVRTTAPMKFNKTGRCRMCSVPFSIINHHAKGLCNRDYMRMLRHEKRHY